MHTRPIHSEAMEPVRCRPACAPAPGRSRHGLLLRSTRWPVGAGASAGRSVNGRFLPQRPGAYVFRVAGCPACRAAGASAGSGQTPGPMGPGPQYPLAACACRDAQPAAHRCADSAPGHRRAAGAAGGPDTRTVPKDRLGRFAAPPDSAPSLSAGSQLLVVSSRVMGLARKAPQRAPHVEHEATRSLNRCRLASQRHARSVPRWSHASPVALCLGQVPESGHSPSHGADQNRLSAGGGPGPASRQGAGDGLDECVGVTCLIAAA